jgi:hypothetical protein
LVPLKFDVLAKISTILPSIEWREIDVFQQTVPLHQQKLSEYTKFILQKLATKSSLKIHWP